VKIGHYLHGMRTFTLALALLMIAATAPAATLEHATFAGGCFWCMQPPFEKLPGVVSVTAGYTGGPKQHPTYEEVSAGGTGHRESVDIVYDPSKISYERLLEVFWSNVDPTDNEGQFCDKGSQYRSAIFFHDAAQRAAAEASKARVIARLHRVYTDILPASTFWPAEEYHQDYYKKNPVRYHFYRFNCGRDQQLEHIWGKAPEH
jgi:peptide-methionine (S)-S-oxide reductase